MSDNPVDEFLEIKTKEAAKKSGDDWADIQKWRAGGMRPELAQPLLDRYGTTFDRFQGQYGGGTTVSPEKVRGALQRQFFKAMQTYDPQKGAAFNTYFQTMAPKALRTVQDLQNVGRMSEQKTQAIGRLQTASVGLQEDLGRAPTTQELAKHLGKSPRFVADVQQGMRRDVPASAFEDDPTEVGVVKELDDLRHIMREPAAYGLNGAETRLLHMIYAPTPITSTKALAQKMGLSQPAVSKLKSSALTKIDKARKQR